MFSAYLARTVNQPTHSYRFLPFILRSIAAQHGSSYSHSTYTFSQAFRQTLGIRSPRLDYSYFSTLQPPHVHNHYETINFTQLTECIDESKKLGVIELVKLLRSNFDSEGVESKDFLDGSGIKPSEDLIVSVIWALRDEWKLAFFVFKWGQKWRCDDEKAWSLIIWVLGNHKKFNNAWCLIRDLYQSSMDTQRPMFILIDRYAAANEPAEAIRTFQIMEKFKLSPDQKAFYTLLYTLCKHGNVEEAEEFMFLNTKLFPLETEGFNIILGGWCNIFVDIFEAKRIWKEMDKCRVIPDETSYTHLISCFSKVNNLFDSLRLYDEMKKKGWKPNREVYNSLVYVLARENCYNEALRILHKMKEANLKPDSSTYNLILRPLCESGKLEDARSILSRMLEENVSPAIDTYHAFLEGTGVSFEERLELLDRMAKSGNGPNKDTFLILVGKFFQLDEVENALKIWVKMKEFEVSPDSAHFMIMVEGLVRHGLTGKARELYADMISIGITDDPKLKKLLKDSSQDDERRKIKKPGMRNAKYGDRGGRGRRMKKWVRGK
ncbi:pentatricopeptide repeat-containing protein At1g80880, mitochondrial [Cynara cardunculus var. scolymus]|uniref:Pentatricopeptide repeat-containing protein n=1 Tax=Cynara cardunculus var. scolymus TaxID=59895 RepID=A0A103YBL3_CYNCS|nr:pentatricopeptide repeat-containing protein At1g80880, mitochondrial [Cynara cardunculus var. scolymus]KVI06098.1 Pentatricopeptide repeat-containing protein [Cynara cardunculus var. scolymus]